jgi:hypothetical protein
MSAIKEWFGIYNMIFRHLKNNYGEDELEDYLKYLGDKAYCDISAEYREKGIEWIKERYTENFKKDGGTAIDSFADGIMKMEVESCPAYGYMNASDNPYDKPEIYFCDCCVKLNKRILRNAGYLLEVSECNNNGKCRWSVKKEVSL